MVCSNRLRCNVVKHLNKEKVMKIIYLVASVILLAACGGDSGGSSSSLSNIAGIYEYNYEPDVIGSENDEGYIIITEDGRYTEYDFLGDAFDQGSNCYIIFDFDIESLGGTSYLLSNDDGDEGTATIDETENGLLITITSFNEEEFEFEIPVTQNTSILESDLTPDCDA